MARPPRINLPACLYHVICRGNKNERVFLIDTDRRRFIWCLDKYARIFSFRVHAYCLMDTHVHLLLESTHPNLSEFMRRLLLAYTVWFHRKHGTCGHLFSGRFKSIVVDKAAYLLSVSRYIHMNPVEAGIIERAGDYPWSSMQYYLKPRRAPKYLYTEETLRWFDGRPRGYAKFVRDGLDEEIKPQIVEQAYVGNKAFVKRIKKRMARRIGVDYTGQSDNISKGLNLIKGICRKFGIKPHELKKKGRRDKKSLKCLTESIYQLREKTEWTFRQIAEYFNISTIYPQILYLRAKKRGDFSKQV